MNLVNNFQNIRQSLLEEDSSVEQHKKLALELNVFGEDEYAKYLNNQNLQCNKAI